MKRLQASVDFQPLSDQLGTSISNFISSLNPMRETEQPAFHKRLQFFALENFPRLKLSNNGSNSASLSF
jgi:hypothetical protein